MRAFFDFQGYLFDLDGCLYRGDEALPGARDLLGLLRKQGKPVSFVSNNSSQTRQQIARRLVTLGIEAEAHEVWVPTDSAGDFVKEAFGEVSVYPVGGPGIASALVEAGLRVATAQSARCDVVFVARDLAFSFDKLQAATRLVQGGASLVAANRDSSHPGEAGIKVPETGALVAAVVEVVGGQPLVLGKPEPYLFQKALAGMGRAPEDVVMVGDNLDTDIAGARALGLASVWINPEGCTVPDDRSPSRTCRNLSELLIEWQQNQGGNT